MFSTEEAGQISGALSAGVFVADGAASDIARLYHGILDRAPDAWGLSSGAAFEHGGTSLQTIVQSFLASPEYAGAHPTALNDKDFITNLYANALGRSPEPDGLTGWEDELAHGATRAAVAIGIVESPEARQHLLSEIEAGFHLV